LVVINHASPGELANCKFYLNQTPKIYRRARMPHNKGANGCVVVVEVISTIVAGTEVLVDYGWDLSSRTRHQKYVSAVGHKGTQASTKIFDMEDYQERMNVGQIKGVSFDTISYDTWGNFVVVDDSSFQKPVESFHNYGNPK
jgi:hypothetical protein